MQEGAREILAVMKEAAKGIVEANQTDDMVTLILESLSPLTLRKEIVDIKFIGPEVIMPWGLYFKEEDLGKKYVCMQANGGQAVYVMYERRG